MLNSIRTFLAIIYLLSLVSTFIIAILQHSAKKKGIDGLLKMMEYESVFTLLGVMMFLTGILLSILTLIP